MWFPKYPLPNQIYSREDHVIILSTLLTGPSGSGDTCDTTKYPADTIANAMAMDSQTFVSSGFRKLNGPGSSGTDFWYRIDTPRFINGFLHLHSCQQWPKMVKSGREWSRMSGIVSDLGWWNVSFVKWTTDSRSKVIVSGAIAISASSGIHALYSIYPVREPTGLVCGSLSFISQ